MTNNQHPLWRDRSRQEATRDVIFILQRPEYLLTCEPEGWKLVDDGFLESEDGKKTISPKEAYELKLENEYGGNAVILNWLPDRVFLSREEAESWVAQRIYNYSEGYRIYGLPCEGDLVKVLNAGYWNGVSVPEGSPVE